MRIGKKFIVPAVCLAAFTVFGQGTNNVGKSIEQLKKYISLGNVTVSDYRDTKNKDQKMFLLKVTSEQDKDMGFEGVMRLTVELTGKDGAVWYKQITKAQGAGSKKLDYIGSDVWEFRVSQGQLKYPQMVYAVEYGYQPTNGAFVAVCQQFRKVESADEIMTRNKGSKNLLKVTAKAVGEGESVAE